MGLTNAPAEFMAMMEDTFRQELNKFILVFLDDILIYSRTLEEHDQHLRAAMEKLRARKLHAKISKCQFFRAEVEFLGHYVGRAGVRMVEGKVAAVQQWPVPTKQKDVEQFLGLSGYYRRFIKDFSKIASPLSALCGTLKKSEKGARKEPPKKVFHWGDEEQRAFDTLKAAGGERAVSGNAGPGQGVYRAHGRVGLCDGRGSHAAIRGGTASGGLFIEEDEGGGDELSSARAGAAGNTQRTARVEALSRRATVYRADGPSVIAIRGVIGNGDTETDAMGDTHVGI